MIKNSHLLTCCIVPQASSPIHTASDYILPIRRNSHTCNDVAMACENVHCLTGRNIPNTGGLIIATCCEDQFAIRREVTSLNPTGVPDRKSTRLNSSHGYIS